MENQSSTILFLKNRSLAGRLSVAFEFIEKNFKVLLKFSALFCLPLGILTSLFYSLLEKEFNTFSTPSSTISPEIYMYMGIFILLNIFGGLCLKSMFYSLVKEYILHGSISDITFKQIKNQLVSNFKRYAVVLIITLFLLLLLSIVISSLIYINLWFLLLVVLVILYLVVPFLYFQEVYMFEKVSVKTALKKGFAMGTTNWGTTLLLQILSMIFVFIFQALVCLPWGIGRIVQSLAFNSTLDGNVSNLPTYFAFLVFLLGAIAFFFTYLAQLYPSLAMMFQYFSAKQKEIEKEAIKEQMQQAD